MWLPLLDMHQVFSVALMRSLSVGLYSCYAKAYKHAALTAVATLNAYTVMSQGLLLIRLSTLFGVLRSVLILGVPVCSVLLSGSMLLMAKYLAFDRVIINHSYL